VLVVSLAALASGIDTASVCTTPVDGTVGGSVDELEFDALIVFKMLSISRLPKFDTADARFVEGGIGSK